jgi:predicted dehydrogenase
LAGGGCILDLGCHCVEITRSYIGKDIKPVEVMCWADTQVKPIEAEDHAIGLINMKPALLHSLKLAGPFAAASICAMK